MPRAIGLVDAGACCTACYVKLMLPCGAAAPAKYDGSDNPTCWGGAADKQRNVKVEQARALQDSLSTYAFSSGARVVLLEQIDIFTPQAQNALLKVIEEPDSNTFFLLTCENEHAVLTTIRSRCQIQRIPTWPALLLEKQLAENGFPADDARSLAVLSGGSPGSAHAMHGDKQLWDMKELVDDAVLSLNDNSSLPHSSSASKTCRDQADAILDYIENAAIRY